MHPLSGVLYAEDFDLPEPPRAALVETTPEPAPAPIVLEPTFSLADLRHAAEHAEAQGRAQERQDTEQNASALRAEALGRIADALNQARAEAARITADAAAALAETMLAAVAAVLPTLARQRGQQEAAALLGLLLPAMSHEPRLSIRVHPSMLEDLRVETSALLQDGPTVVEWLGSDTLQPGDIIVRWQDGMMVRDVGALCARAAALIMRDSVQADTIQETNHGQ